MNASVALLAVAAAWATPEAKRVLVAVSNSDAPGRDHLVHAARDAQELRRVLEELGGLDDVVTLTDERSDALTRALARLAADDDTTLFFYFSGHGDAGGLLMGDTRFSYEALRSALAGAGAGLTITIVDACQSGAVVREKGSAVPIAAELEEHGRFRGSVFISSSASDQSALESDALGSYFTHALVSGLRGAADSSGDGVVTLDEAYAYAYRRTLDLSGRQRPAYRTELGGHGALALTVIAKSDARLAFPLGAAGRYLVERLDSRRAPAGVETRAGERVTVGLAAGEYRVVREDCSTQEVTLAAGREVVLDEARFAPTPCAAGRVKGGGFSVEAAARLASAYLIDAPPRAGGAVRLSWSRGALRFGPTVAYAVSSYVRRDSLEIAAHEVSAGAFAAAVWQPAEWLELEAGVAAELALVLQSARTDLDEALRAGVVPSVVLQPGLRLRPGDGWFLAARGLIGGLVNDGARLTAGAEIGVGVAP